MNIHGMMTDEELAQDLSEQSAKLSGNKDKHLSNLLNETRVRLEQFDKSPEPRHEKLRKRRSSRAARFDEAQSEASNAKNTMEELRDELQSWLDGMPENMQSGSKADQLNDAISELDTIVGSLEEVEGASVEFPGMFG